MRSTPGTAAHARLAGGFVGLWGAVTLFDIGRLNRGEHVTAVEAAVAGLGALAVARGAASLRRAGATPTDPGAGSRTARSSRPRR